MPEGTAAAEAIYASGIQVSQKSWHQGAIKHLM
jgi:hypothetical protein